MRMSRSVAGLVIVAAAALLLGGCAQPAARVIPTAPATMKPVFATDADALAAAEKSFAGYLTTSDLIAHDGGVGVERLGSWDTVSQLALDAKTFDGMQSRGEHTTGTSVFSHLVVQSRDLNADGSATLIAYVCVDVSHTQLLDDKNAVRPVARPKNVPLVLTFRSDETVRTTLRFDGSVAWRGKNYCS
jgi:hypothetical protein